LDEKIIVTHVGALKAKYGASGWKQINAAVKALIAADKKRGLASKLVALDSPTAMKAYGGKAVTNSGEARQVKAAIDAIDAKTAPEYILILGAADVVPHVELNNPVFSTGDGDPDEFVPSDLPYACDAGYSKKIEDFLGPTRVVGRLPDIAGSKDPAYLIGLLKTAVAWKQGSRNDYVSYLGMTAAVWKGSTAMSLDRTFGSNTDLQLVPPKGPQWPVPFLSRRSHFINCHGAPSDPQFYGQQGSNYPVSHMASYINGKITEGTVCAAECCYGAELYNPAAANGQMGIGQTYLGSKAYAYFGSTTVAYGPADGNGSADLICQFFLRRILSGASSGRSALEARQQFAQSSPNLDPSDIKTMGQFILLGDPSVTPVASEAVKEVPQAKNVVYFALTEQVQRTERRQQLRARGKQILDTVSYAIRRPQAKPKPSLKKQLETLARKAGFTASGVLTFGIKQPAQKKALFGKAFAAKLLDPGEFHIVYGKTKEKHERVSSDVLIVARTIGGKVASVRQLYARSKRQ